jgi:hypothetical protein
MKTRKKSVNRKKGRKTVNWQLIINIIVPIVAVVGLVATNLYYRSQKKQYIERLLPELDCYYEYQALKDTCEFYVKNVGLVDCKNIWVEEKVFVIVGDSVYEGDDVPHFNCFVFKDSRTSMFDLPKNLAHPIELENLQGKAFTRLHDKFQCKIISRWLISFSSRVSSKRYQLEKYFIHTLEDRIPQDLELYVGGISILNKIRNYLTSGAKRSIRIFDLTMDFELDTPTSFLINEDGSIVPLFPWTTLSIEDMNNARFFTCTPETQPSDDMKGSVKYIWVCKDGKWQKWTKGEGASRWITEQMPLLPGYLSKEDAERVRQNPKLIRLFDPDKQPSSEEQGKELEKEITQNARIKFLAKYKK